jgi:kinetochore protein NNF1
LNVQKQFENILEDRNVVPSLNSLDHLIREALSRKEVAENEASATGASVAQPTP